MWGGLTLAELLRQVPWSFILRLSLNQAWRFVQEQERTDFLVYDPKALNVWYRNERLLGGYLPYREEANWIDEIKAGHQPKISLEIGKQQFHLDQGGASWHATQSEAYGAFTGAGHARSNSTIIRLDAIAKNGESTSLKVRSAKYSDQAQSNLILDYKSLNEFTLRQLLLGETQNSLPALNDTRLANTVGMATLILYPDRNGLPTPYLVRRAKNLAVYPGGVHVSASCAAEWQNGAVTFQELFISDMLEEINQELGLGKDQLEHFHPVALCREFLRGGKPQFFFIATTSLTRKELRGYRAIAMARSKRYGPEKVEILPDHWWRRSDLVSRIGYYGTLRRGMSLEGAAALYYLAELVQRVSK